MKIEYKNDQIKEPKYEQCLVCLEDIKQNTEICGKENEYCQQCINSHIKSKMNNKDILKIPCLVSTCNHFWSEDQIKLLTNETLFKSYQKLKKVIELNKMEGIIFCAKTECDGYQINKNNKKCVTCQQCNTQICTICKQEWHEGINCQQMLVKVLKDTNVTNNVQFCPRLNCRAPIQKIQGCNHMICYQCGRQFCWLCKGRVTGFHYKSYNIFSNCRKQQFQDQNLEQVKNKQQNSFCVQFWLFILQIFMILLIIGFLPLILVVLGFMVPGIYIENDYIFKVRRKKRIYVRIGYIVLSILFLPITIVFIIFPGSCMYTRFLYKEGFL